MFLVTLLFAAAFIAQAQTPDPLVAKIQAELSGPFPPAEAKVDPSIPHGELLQGKVTNSSTYPGTENNFQVYVPAQYDPSTPACLLVKLDGIGAFEGTVLDHLIAAHEVPVIIAVGITPGTIWKDPTGTPQRSAYRFNRSYEFDSTNDHFPDFVLNEILPAVQRLKTGDGRVIRFSSDGNDHAATGGSTGGIGAFTLAWRRPDQFTRIYSVIGTFVSMRGGNEYPVLIRKTDPKPIRIFLEDGSSDAWNPLFGTWYDANLNMESALTFGGYDVAHAWGTHGHDGRPGQVIFPDVMRWLWRGYPARISPGVSKNSTLQEITLPDEPWRMLPQANGTVAGMAANQEGRVTLSSDPAISTHHMTSMAYGPDGTLYGVVPGEKKIIALNSSGRTRIIAAGVAAHSITVTHDGAIYVSEPGAHSDMPSRIWQWKNEQKRLIDQGVPSASGIAFSPDGSLFFVAEKSTQWIDSYVVQPDGSFAAKQHFFWLHMTDVPNNSGAEALAVDIHGNLYVATRIGIQVCDQNGRVRAILPLPSPSGPVLSLAFGGEHFDTLYASDGTRVFTRRLKIPGHAPWSSPIKVASQGPG